MHDKRSEKSSLEQSFLTLQPMDPDIARTVLVEAKKILDQLGVIFFLRQGTCLGAIRDKGFIPWGDGLPCSQQKKLNLLHKMLPT